MLGKLLFGDTAAAMKRDAARQAKEGARRGDKSFTEEAVDTRRRAAQLQAEEKRTKWFDIFG